MTSNDEEAPRLVFKRRSEHITIADEYTVLLSQSNTVREFILHAEGGLENHFITTLLFFEPWVTTERKAPRLFESQPGTWEQLFTDRKIYFCPKVFLLQSRVPLFALHKSFLEFYYEVVLEDFVKGCAPLKLRNEFRAPGELFSCASVKELFFSVLFSFTIPGGKFFVERVLMNSCSFRVENILYKGCQLSADLARFVTWLSATESAMRIFSRFLLCVLLEGKVVAVCSDPSVLLCAMDLALFPLSSHQQVARNSRS